MFPSPRLVMAREKLSLLMQCFADRTGGHPLIRRGSGGGLQAAGRQMTAAPRETRRARRGERLPMLTLAMKPEVEQEPISDR
jgi:hypothetical protein